MNEIQLKLNSNNRGEFAVDENGERLAEMAIGIQAQHLIVYHTQVSEKLRGQNMGKQLIQKMTEYARGNHLKVVPLCPFVAGQFKRYEAEYSDIWEKNYKDISI